MEMHNVSLRGIKVDSLAHELATSEGTRPYLDCEIKAHLNNAVAFESALRVGVATVDGLNLAARAGRPRRPLDTVTKSRPEPLSWTRHNPLSHVVEDAVPAALTGGDALN